MTEVELLELFSDKSVPYGSELIVKKAYCSEYVRVSQSEGFAIIGIEGFYLQEDGRVIPNLDEIADFSDIELENNRSKYIQACFEAASRFLVHMNTAGKSDGYCFTLADSDS